MWYVVSFSQDMVRSMDGGILYLFRAQDTWFGAQIGAGYLVITENTPR